jgi:hypothetical protein
MSNAKGFSVADHLQAMGETRDWVIELGDAIHELSERDPAVAASRAMDLAKSPSLGPAIQKIMAGWKETREALKDLRVTPWQRVTIADLLHGIVADLETISKSN